MILTIDIGNTNIKMGVFADSGSLVGLFQAGSDCNRTVDESIVLIQQMLTNADITKSEIDGAIISSVVPKTKDVFISAVNGIFGIQPIVVSHELNTGIKINYNCPKTLGSDRIITCVAAEHKYGAPFILVDFGTATTFNVVDSNGEFVGGAITLGLQTTMDCLTKCTAKLPSVTLDVPQNAVMQSTEEAMRSGVVLGAVGQVKYIIDRIKSELGIENPKTIATGGLSHIVQSVDPIFDYVDRGLSLDGLYKIYKSNAYVYAEEQAQLTAAVEL